MPRFIWALALIGCVCSVLAAPHRLSAEVILRLEAESGFVEVKPISSALQSRLQDNVANTARAHLAVYVDRHGSPGEIPALLGSYEVDGGALRFQPRFAFRPGLSYVALFDPKGQLPRGTATLSNTTNTEVRRLRFTIPDKSRGPGQRVVNVYPSVDRLPANLLKFYIHFSGPMSRGEAYRRIELLDEKGHPVELAFLRIAEELWDPDGQRFTLLFDPGRVKRGLQPRAEDGPVLQSGRQYTLRIDAGWKDAGGMPLQETFEKTFAVVSADYDQPQPSKWSLLVPLSGTTDPMVVTFRESLDHAMLARVMKVFDRDNHEILGTSQIDQHETRWSFRPTSAWKAGRYRLAFDVALEDVAGNSVGRPFEVVGEQPAESVVNAVPFEIRKTP